MCSVSFFSARTGMGERFLVLPLGSVTCFIHIWRFRPMILVLAFPFISMALGKSLYISWHPLLICKTPDDFKGLFQLRLDVIVGVCDSVKMGRLLWVLEPSRNSGLLETPDWSWRYSIFCFIQLHAQSPYCMQNTLRPMRGQESRQLLTFSVV